MNHPNDLRQYPPKNDDLSLQNTATDGNRIAMWSGWDEVQSKGHRNVEVRMNTKAYHKCPTKWPAAR